MGVAIAIFLFTLILVIFQPKGLKIGTSAVIGAVLAYIFGVVSLTDMVEVGSVVWDATLSFIGIIILSMVLRYRDWETDRKSTRLNSSHITRSRMPSSA